jgi:hypothetical protein
VSILFAIAILLFLVSVFGTAILKIKGKGTIGESRVARQLDGLNNEEYIVLNDILIKTSKRSSQIDHIVVSVYGIFVIETKNYTGWIHGNENSEYWTQSIYKKKFKFYNPIKQNWAHIYALKKVLSDFGELTYHPIVVFAGSAKLKNINSNIPVVYASQLVLTIMVTKGTPNLSTDQVKNIADRLREITIQDATIKKEHIDQIKDHKHKKEQKVKALLCPRCDGSLILRNGKYGKFYGCSNYPKCRYTKNIK